MELSKEVENHNSWKTNPTFGRKKWTWGFVSSCDPHHLPFGKILDGNDGKVGHMQGESRNLKPIPCQIG